MSRKGVFFSIIALFLVGIMVLRGEILKESDTSSRQIEISRIRVELLDSIVYDFESNALSNAIDLASKVALQSLSDYSRDKYVQNIEADFLNVFNDGTIMDSGGMVPIDNITNELNDNQNLMAGRSFRDSMSRVSELLNSEEVSLKSAEASLVSLTQESPWAVTAKFRINYELHSNDRIAGWKGEFTKESVISILGMYAPDTSESIKESIIVSSDEWSADTTATNATFLMRLQGDFNHALSNGICLKEQECDR